MYRSANGRSHARNRRSSLISHWLATLTLGPLLLAQGHHVRRNVPLLPEPDGLREGVEGTGPPLRLLIFGDSAAAGVGASTQRDALSGQLAAALKDSFEVHWKLVARTGATSRDALHTLNELPAEPFDIVVTSLGVNDVTARLTLREWQRGQLRLISLLEQKFAARHIFLSALPPMHRFPALPQPLRWYIGSRAMQFNQALARLAGQRPGCKFVALGYTDLATESMATDGFHPGPAVYRKWAEAVAEQIKNRVPFREFRRVTSD